MSHAPRNMPVDVTSYEYPPEQTSIARQASAACFNLLVNTRIGIDGNIASAKSTEPHPQSLRGLAARQDPHKQQQIERLDRLRAAQGR
jgi:hypothetical protein